MPAFTTSFDGGMSSEDAAAYKVLLEILQVADKVEVW